MTNSNDDEGDPEGDTWDSWDNSFGVTVVPNSNTQIEALRQTETENLPQDTLNNTDINEEVNNVPDFFEDLEPVIQKQSKVYKIPFTLLNYCVIYTTS